MSLSPFPLEVNKKFITILCQMLMSSVKGY